MIEKLNYRFAALALILVPGLLIVFHVANLLGFLPVNIIWTGRITSTNAMYAMGLVSIALNIAYMWFGAVRVGYIKNTTALAFSNKLYPFLFWWLVGNSFVNLFSKSYIEVYLFNPILLLLVICCYRVKAHERG